MAYYFGIYHWRSQMRSLGALLLGLGLAAVALVLPRPVGPGLAVLALGSGVYWGRGVERLLRPRPWKLDQAKYDALADPLLLSEADRVLDFGCGTGRSLVGLAPHLAPDSTLVGLDRFDDRIIFGNSPRVAARNTKKAGLTVEFLRADGRALPVATDAIDVVTVSQVLHDLPEPVVDLILPELRRVLAPRGQLGLIELPLVDDSRSVGPEFWTEKLVESGFNIEFVEQWPWKDDQTRVLVVASPTSESE